MRNTAIVSLVCLVAFAASAQTTMTFTYQINGPLPPAQTFPVTSTNPSYQIPYLTVDVEPPQSWLVATLSDTTTPAVVTVSLSPAGMASLPAGSYAGNVAVSSFLLAEGFYIPVVLTITPAAPRLSLSPSGFVFNAFETGPAPPTQTLVVGASNSGVAVSSTLTTPLPKWLNLYEPLPNNPTAPWTGSGTAPVTITVAVDQTGLTPGTYSYTIPFSSAQGSNVNASVVLVVANPSLAVSTNQLLLQCSAGLANPAPQTIQVQGTGGASLVASITVSVPWLAANVLSGTTPFSLSIQPDCAALAAGTYTGKVTIADSSFSDSQTINVVLNVGQPISSIANVTNAAVPGLDNPPATVTLAPQSMATIFGTNLSDSIVVSPSPWSSPLGGTEVHLARDACFDTSCDLIADLIYVSPAQINFLVPDTTATGPIPYRVVLMRDGQRIDDQGAMTGGPGRVIIDPSGAADSSVVFEVGYDCLFSSSLSDPASCGLSWSAGQDRAPLGAITDAVTGQLISSQNPVYQGRLITLWMTALKGGVALDSQTGLQTGKTMAPVGFGVAQFGKDIEGTLGVETPAAPDTPSIPVGTFMSPTPLWAGESPQFVGLDQVNVAFPTCVNAPAATSEKRYDAFLTYTSATTGATSRIYIPFDVRIGDPDCQWASTKTSTSIALTASPNPSTAGQATVLTATVSPTTATGVVTFFDGNSMLGSQTLSAGVAALSVYTLSPGTHSIGVLYNGDSTCTGGTSLLTLIVAPKPSVVAVSSNRNPSVLGASVTFTAAVSPAAATGTVTFLDGIAAVGSATLNAGTATVSVSTLSVGSHSITATYSGDASYASSTSAPLTETIGGVPSALTLSPPDATVPWGASATFTATVLPSTATGTVTLFDGELANCNTAPVALGTMALSGVSATFSVAITCTGAIACRLGEPNCVSSMAVAHKLWATYSGDPYTAGSTSSQVLLTVDGTPTSIAFVANQSTISNSNPTPGPLITATVTPAQAVGSVLFGYLTQTGFGTLACNGLEPVPLVNGQAVCNATPGLFPGPGTYGVTAIFFPSTDQYYASGDYYTARSVSVTP